MDHTRLFTAGFLACGLGAGARGFINARASLGKRERARFRNLGGIDIDEEACRDFEYLTGAKAHRADIHTMQPEGLRAIFGEEAPDCLFSSSPCKGFSRLLPKKMALLPKYQELNRLVFKSFWLACEAWERPPGLLVLENVEGIKSRGAELLIQIRSLLGGYGYVFHESVHDCGVIGGLAQHRDRFLMVARLPERVREYVYRPPRQRVKGCGEVLEQLPVPGISGSEAGPLHVMPKISWINWVRLALIPAGKDWRALPKNAGELSLKLAAANAGSFKGRPGLFGVQDWSEPARTVNGSMKVSGGNSAAAVSDPRTSELSLGYEPVRDSFGVQDWNEPSKVVRGKMEVRTAPAAVADPLFRPADDEKWFGGTHGVMPWDKPARAVVGGPSNGAANVADPLIRPQAGNPGMHTNKYNVVDWDKPVKTIVGAGRVGSGAQSVADPRTPVAMTHTRETRFSNQYKVRAWHEPVGCITSDTDIQCGLQSVADPRPVIAKKGRKTWSGRGNFGVIDWKKPAPTVRGRNEVQNSTAAVADPRLAPPFLSEADLRFFDQVCALRQAEELLAQTIRGPERFGHCDKVSAWDEPVGTITHAPAPSSGGGAVADPRPIGLNLDDSAFRNLYRVCDWKQPLTTITGASRPGGGAQSIADPRADQMLYSPVPEGVDPREFFAKYDVRGWEQPARTVAGSGTNGGYAVADPLARDAEAVRIKCTPRNGAYGVMSWADAARTITGVGQIDNATVAVADPRKAPEELIVIISEDGCWHRPITPLELAVLQGMPHQINGKPLVLAGKSVTRWRERIGNAVPVQAAQAIAESLLTALLATATNQWSLSTEGIWVEKDTGNSEYDYEFVDDPQVSA